VESSFEGKRILLTGAAGFVGSHVLRHLLKRTKAEIVCPVTFRHKGFPARIISAAEGIEIDGGAPARVTVMMMDLTAPADPISISRMGHIDYILNVASESHVDRSITDPVPFVMNNTALILNTLELARVLRPDVFLQMSTDEVYGPAPMGYSHREWDPICPSNPYSASKAAQEAIAISYWRTYGVPVVITNTMNIIGEMQDVEKMVPKTIKLLTNGEPVPVHCDTDGSPGSRFYLHARNLADAWLFLLRQEGKLWDLNMHVDGSGRPSRFNIVGEQEVDNITLVKQVARIMGVMPRYEKQSFHASRPGHDLRYALDGSRMAKLGVNGWHPPFPFDSSLETTVRWTLDHPEWLQ
jgi:dTDP-glucose 4,6-dehydratase